MRNIYIVALVSLFGFIMTPTSLIANGTPANSDVFKAFNDYQNALKILKRAEMVVTKTKAIAKAIAKKSDKELEKLLDEKLQTAFNAICEGEAAEKAMPKTKDATQRAKDELIKKIKSATYKDLKGEKGKTLLIKAVYALKDNPCEPGHRDVVRAIMKNDAGTKLLNIVEQDTNMTPIHLAIFFSYIHAVNLRAINFLEGLIGTNDKVTKFIATVERKKDDVSILVEMLAGSYRYHNMPVPPLHPTSLFYKTVKQLPPNYNQTISYTPLKLVEILESYDTAMKLSDLPIPSELIPANYANKKIPAPELRFIKNVLSDLNLNIHRTISQSLDRLASALNSINK